MKKLLLLILSIILFTTIAQGGLKVSDHSLPEKSITVSKFNKDTFDCAAIYHIGHKRINEVWVTYNLAVKFDKDRELMFGKEFCVGPCKIPDEKSFVLRKVESTTNEWLSVKPLNGWMFRIYPSDTGHSIILRTWEVGYPGASEYTDYSFASIPPGSKCER